MMCGTVYHMHYAMHHMHYHMYHVCNDQHFINAIPTGLIDCVDTADIMLEKLTLSINDFQLSVGHWNHRNYSIKWTDFNAAHSAVRFRHIFPIRYELSLIGNGKSRRIQWIKIGISAFKKLEWSRRNDHINGFGW